MICISKATNKEKRQRMTWMCEQWHRRKIFLRGWHLEGSGAWAPARCCGNTGEGNLLQCEQTEKASYIGGSAWETNKNTPQRREGRSRGWIRERKFMECAVNYKLLPWAVSCSIRGPASGTRGDLREREAWSLIVENFTIAIDRICCPWQLYLLV